MGERVARRLALTGARLDGREAAALGLADFFCEGEAERDAKLESLLQAVERCAPGANAETKRLFRACRSAFPEAYVETAAKSFADALRGPEGREGLAAFAEKRAPSWTKGRHEPAFFLRPDRQSRRDRLPRHSRRARRGPPRDRRLQRRRRGCAACAPRRRAPSASAPLRLQSPTSRSRTLLAAAKATGAKAVHPGYGFLAESAAFAEACASAGLVFVGPPASAIRAMGDKAAAKTRMEAAGVPCAPGYHGADQSPARFAEEAERIGYPVMVKASAGGGGRGMRIVREPGELEAALRSASAEAETAFGDGRLILERALTGARHVEIQVFGDERGESFISASATARSSAAIRS